MVLFIPIVVTVLVICLIIATIHAITWWKSNHGVVQRQIMKVNNEGIEENVTVAAYTEEEMEPQQIEALLIEYASDILIDDFLTTKRSYILSLVTQILEDNVKKMAEEAATEALRGKVNTLSARAVNTIKEKTEPDNILALLGISEAMTEGYVNDYIAFYHNALDDMDIDSLAKTAAEKVTGDFIKRHFGDKTAYVSTYILGDNKIREDQVTLFRDMFVCNFEPSRSYETHNVENVLSSSDDVLTLSEGGTTGMKLTLYPTPTKPIMYGLFLSKDTAYAINENEWSLKPSDSAVIDIQLNFFGESTPLGNVKACVIVVE